MLEEPITPSPSDEEGQPQLPARWTRVRPSFKNRILTGLIFIVPIFVTLMVARWIYNYLLALSPGFIRSLSEQTVLPAWTKPAIQFSGVVVTLFAIVLILWAVGSLSSSFLMRRTMRLSERVIQGLPVVRWVYSVSKQVMELVGEKQGVSFKRVVIVEFPKEKVFSMGFATGELYYSDRDELQVAVFMPTTPNPTSGYLILYPVSHVREAKITPEQAVRIIVSGGIIVPEEMEVIPYRPRLAADRRLAPALERQAS